MEMNGRELTACQEVSDAGVSRCPWDAPFLPKVPGPPGAAAKTWSRAEGSTDAQGSDRWKQEGGQHRFCFQISRAHFPAVPRWQCATAPLSWRERQQVKTLRPLYRFLRRHTC